VGTVKEKKKLTSVSKALSNTAFDISREGNQKVKNNSELTPERIIEILSRINENFYDREDVLKVVAERILRSPELQEIIKKGQLE
jgi:hypothetical protein